MTDGKITKIKICGNCIFWNGNGQWIGQCRRRSPIADTSQIGKTSHPGPVWPNTLQDGWCGEWSRALAQEGKIISDKMPTKEDIAWAKKEAEEIPPRRADE